MKFLVNSIIFCFVLKLCSGESSDLKGGFCMVDYEVQELIQESYTYTYQKEVCDYGCYRQYNWYPVTKSEIRYKDVPKTIIKKRVECCAGYSNVTIHDNIYHCEPICDPPCIQGLCVSPGKCACYEGFQHLNSSECAPICQPKCVNGKCNTPGECTCHAGYDKINGTHCEPICTHECVNAVCHKPEHCLCNEGFQKSEEFDYICELLCDPPCVNGNCTGPNECECIEGYYDSVFEINYCVTDCILECLHGKCTGPDVCTCDDGYKYVDGNICELDCGICENGFCKSPNECACKEGYVQDDGGICKPVCKNKCTNGYCLIPDFCECSEGYQKNEKDVCVPSCENCQHGECTEPNICECFEGYQNSTGDCLPVCEFGCFHGKCASPNNCSCNDTAKIEDNICYWMNETSRNVKPYRYQVTSLNYNVFDLSSIYIKVKRDDHVSSTCTGNDTNVSSECMLIKDSRKISRLLCSWPGLITNMSLVLVEDGLYLGIGAPSFLSGDELDVTFLLPTNLTSDEGDSYLCPCETNFTLSSDPFRLKLSHCEKTRVSLTINSIWKDTNIVEIGLAVIGVLLVIGFVSSLIINVTKRLRGDYYTQSSREVSMEDMSVPLDPTKHN